jgi:FkbM family methyltransferase
MSEAGPSGGAGLGSAVSVLNYVWTHPANQSAKTASIVRAVRFQARGRVLRKRTVVPLGDRSRLWAELHWTASSRAAYSNPPDLEMLVWKHRLGPDDLFVDIGANVGIYSILGAERGACVIAVEPDPETARRLRANAELNSYRIEILECAVADRGGTELFTVGLDCLNHFADPGSSATREVPVRTLDDIVGDRRVCGVKIDVEGAELRVLEGARCALSEQRIDLLQVEWTKHPPGGFHGSTPVGKYLASVGYALFRDNGAGALEPLTSQKHDRDVFAQPN